MLQVVRVMVIHPIVMHLRYLLVVVILCNVFESSPCLDGLYSSKEERKPMKIDVSGNVSDFTAINSNLVCQHTRSWDLDGVSPVVIVIAKSIRKVENCFFGCVRSVGGNIEMGWLDCSLSNGMRH